MCEGLAEMDLLGVVDSVSARVGLKSNRSKVTKLAFEYQKRKPLMLSTTAFSTGCEASFDLSESSSVISVSSEALDIEEKDEDKSSSKDMSETKDAAES